MTSPTASDKPALGGDGLCDLERQVERGNLFTHTSLSRIAAQVEETQSFLYGLIDLLIRKGLMAKDDIEASALSVNKQMIDSGEAPSAGIALRVEGQQEETNTPVNCSERIHICKAVCCRLHFALSAEEIEAGKVKWDLGAPYHIRQDSCGYCSHIGKDSRCSIYEHRPKVCRSYNCTKDERIWEDFAAMRLNQKWIDENLAGDRPRLLHLRMHR